MTGRLALLALLLATPLYAQGPAADWRTVTTPHFRVHYPKPYEAWSLRAASRLESVRDAVAAEVGFAPDATTDVIVMNPVAEANGLTLPLLDTPRIVLWTEPPDPGEQIGDYSDWIDLLTVHEITHLVHLMRPSRNPLERNLERFVPLNPITLGAPRWALEGYATVVEGRITGAGRPSSTLRALILRRWAETGHLPSYAQLAANDQFLGMSMAYLGGSAYLEWLEQRSGPGSLRKLWARMTARHRRSFGEAFAGVFGDSPERLYGIFIAELTQRALMVEQANPARDGELWQETARDSGDPAVSPDGKSIAVVLRAKSKPARLVVWSTAPPSEEEKKYEERIARMLKRDPEDVAPVRAKPLPRKPLHEFTPPDGGDIDTPRWTADGRSLLYTHRQPDREGFLHHDLFLWTPSTGENVRVTHLADVSDADPLPDGRAAVAVRNRYGYSQLVMVNLLTGAVTPLTEASLDDIATHPRVSADGKRIAYAGHTAHGPWKLFVIPVGGQAPSPVLSSTANIAYPEWSRTNPTDLYATVFESGFADIHRFADGTDERITRARGGAFQPAPSADGRIFFMSLDPGGYVVRVLTPDAQPPAPLVADRALAPAIPPEPSKPVALASQPLPPPHAYGIGRQELASFFGGAYASSAHVTELGMRAGDVVGRLDSFVAASIGDVRGAALASTWRGWPVNIGAHLFSFREHGTHRGGELRASWSAQWPLQSVAVAAGALRDRSRQTAFAAAAFRARQQFAADNQLTEDLHADAQSHLWRGRGRASLRAFGLRFAAQYERAVCGTGALACPSLGGIATTLMPQSFVAQRVFDPALPFDFVTGTHYDGRRVEIGQGYATAFYQQHRIGGERVRDYGLELTTTSPPVPWIKTLGAEATAGAARVRGRTRFWAGLRWRP
jgi:dipeptidyl aminopeptidase/acylaminoacyl peptidase